MLIQNKRYRKLYRNNGDNSFTEHTQIQFPIVTYSCSAWGDYDNDNDLDVVVTGHDGSKRISKIYRNNGNNSFSEQTHIQMTGVMQGSVAWGDYDNDGYLDILLSGQTSSSTQTSKIYRNNGNNTFTEQTHIQLLGLAKSRVAWGDYDNDGYLDILMCGIVLTTNNYIYNEFSKLYHNNSNNTFTEHPQQLINLYDGGATWCDYDNDGDLDIFLAGMVVMGDFYHSKIYRNNATNKNTKPNVITNLQATSSGSSITFTWNKATDANQTGGLSYNLYIYKQGDTEYIKSPQAFAQTTSNNGKQLMAKIGSIQNNSYTINNLPDGNYNWSVQAIDASFAGGAFAPEQAVTVQCETPNNTIQYIGIKTQYSTAMIDTMRSSAESDGYLLFINTTDTWNTPQNGTTYTPNTTWQNNGQQCVYVSGNKNPNITITGLSQNTQYYIKAYAYNYCNNSYLYTTSGTSASFTTFLCQKPTLSVEKIVLKNRKKFSIALDSVIFSGSDAHGYVVFINKTNTWTAPADGSNYTPNTKWQHKGQQCVYKGNQTKPNITIDSLLDNTTYYIKVYTYNYCENTYKYNPNGTETSFKTELCQALPANKIVKKNIYAFSAAIDSVVVPSGNAEGYVVFINSTNTWTLPVNGTTYTPNTTWQNKGQQCLYQGNKTKPNITIGSLTDNTTYYIKVYTYNYCLNTYKYDMQGIETNFTTKACNTPTKTINSLLTNSYTSISLQIDSIITSTTGQANGYILFINNIDTLIPPVDATNYTPNTIWSNTGQQCVYIGNNKKTNISITGLMPDTRYYITAYTYSICDTDYKKYNPTGKKVGVTTAPAQFQQQNDIQFNATATNGSWGDYDNDGDFDFYSVQNQAYIIDTLLIEDDSSFVFTEEDSSYRVTYINNGNNAFTPHKSSEGTLGSFAGTVQWADYDNDNDVDISLTGKSSYIWKRWEDVAYLCDSCFWECSNINGGWCNWVCIPKVCYRNEYVESLVENQMFGVYKNNNNENFETNILISSSNAYGQKWGDYDNDGDLDILSANGGIYQNTGGQFTTKHYITGSEWGDYDNDGDLDVLSTYNTYENRENNFIQSLGIGGNAWGDYDNDGDLDILANDKVYQNTSSGFVQIGNVGGLAWGDYDNDGFLDILSQQYVYKNDGQGHFVPVQYFESAYGWVDYDNDGRLDVWAKDEDDSFTLYRNATQPTNITPTAPTNLQATQHDDYVEFTWDAATDVNQSGGLSYNLYVYNNDAKTYAKSPQSLVGNNDSLNGNRLLVQRGDIQGTSYKLKLLDGNYSWSVQAIDASFAGGKFAPSQNFTFECPRATATVANAAIEQITIQSAVINSLTLSAGHASGYVVFINDTNTFVVPEDGQHFVVENFWRHNGQQCIYMGDNGNAYISGLDDNTRYYIKVYTYSAPK